MPNKILNTVRWRSLGRSAALLLRAGSHAVWHLMGILSHFTKWHVNFGVNEKKSDGGDFVAAETRVLSKAGPQSYGVIFWNRGVGQFEAQWSPIFRKNRSRSLTNTLIEPK